MMTHNTHVNSTPPLTPPRLRGGELWRSQSGVGFSGIMDNLADMILRILTRVRKNGKESAGNWAEIQ
ncbi:MAG: hypothetical protein ACHBN1_05420 [Heteroscytonema crispum UTEX LB 1556]